MCDDLVKQIVNERQQRMEIQREIAVESVRNHENMNEPKAVTASTTDGSKDDNDSVLLGTIHSLTHSLTHAYSLMLTHPYLLTHSLIETTLGMLRCSVCKDRFKSVAITRCYHLFCKECIDENLRNRQRKCPACGDKFGENDVRTVSFT